jgi:hypothetical protein
MSYVDIYDEVRSQDTESQPNDKRPCPLENVEEKIFLEPMTEFCPTFELNSINDAVIFNIGTKSSEDTQPEPNDGLHAI